MTHYRRWAVAAIVAVLAVVVVPITYADAQEELDLWSDLPDVKPPSIHSPPSASELEDIAVAARDFNISMEEAVAQYGWRDNFGIWASEIAESYPNEFARAEIVDGSTAWIAFAGVPPNGVRRSMLSFGSAFPHVSIEIRQGIGYTAGELNDAVIAVHKAAMSRPEVVDAVTEFWSLDGTIEVTVSVDSRSATMSPDDYEVVFDLPEVQTLAGALQTEVTVVAGKTLSGDDSWGSHYGGEALSSCTSGFGTRNVNNATGTRGISTAGHCGNNLSDDGRSLTYQSGTDDWYGDFQWHTGPGSESDDFYSGNSSTLEVNRRDVSYAPHTYPGDWVCTNGKTTQKNCDTVLNTGVCTGGNCNMFSMHNREQAGGDSGAPAFYGNGARALHEGWYTSQGSRRDTKSNLSYMPLAIGVYVATQ